MQRVLSFSWALVAALIACAASASVAGAQPVTTTALMRSQFDFENDLTPWVSLGNEAKISRSEELAHVKNGRGALRFDYGVHAGQINALLLPTPLHGLSDTKAITFWIAPDYDTPLFVMLQEQDGGRYGAIFGARANLWQRVELSSRDFLLLDGPDDPQDPDSRLDLDQVAALAVADLGQIYAGATDPKIAALLGLQAGPHTFFLDDFALQTQELPVPAGTAPAGAIAAGNADENEVLLEPLLHPQLAWTSLGGAQLSTQSTADLPGRSLQAKTVQKRGEMTGMLRRFPLGILRGTTRLRFEATSDKTATLIVRLEEKGGGKYALPVHLDGGGQINTISLNFADFKPTDDSKDANNRLDIEQMQQLSFIDVTGLGETPGGDNTLTFNNLRAVK